MIDIKDKSGKVLFSTLINKGSKRKFQLMKEDYITLKFSLPQPIYFSLGDGIDNEIGMFELVDLYKPTYNAENSGYDYELRLDAYYWKWKNKKFFYIPEDGGREAGWNLMATLDTHMKVFLHNIEVLGYQYNDEPFICEIDDTVEKSSKPITYENVNLIDALTQMAEAWGCEWWVKKGTIHFGRCENNQNSPVDFELNKNVASMDRSDSQSKYATRIYAFGSTRNIPPSYLKKLVFDVKNVNGRDISDTARVLDIVYFPENTTCKEEYKIDESLSYFLGTGNVEATSDYTISQNLIGGTYRITNSVLSFNVSTFYLPGMTVQRANLPAGEYLFKATYRYKINGIQKEIPIGSKTITLRENQQPELSIVLDVPRELKIEKGATDFKINNYAHIPWALLLNLSCNFKIKQDLKNGSSAITSVTFLSGLNKGKRFEAVYNPDLLIGDGANIIRLPEGVTASLGDMYTINNIIKGKVSADYFSKDDNEASLNSVVQKRLMLPAGVPYIEADEDMTQEELVEEIVVFDDVYAKYIGSTTEVLKPRWEEEASDEEGKGQKEVKKKYPIYTFKDTELKNFSADFKLGEIRLVFQTGKLAGLDFALKLIEGNNTGTTFDIIRNDDYGQFLPNEILFPQMSHMENGIEVPADTYFLYNFDTAFISEELLPKAELELKEKAEAYIKMSKIDPSTYNCRMIASAIYNAGNIINYGLGDCVNLINKAYFDKGRKSRIIGYECGLDIPYDHPVYTVGETAAYSRLGAIESRMDSLTFQGQTYIGTGATGGGSSVYVIGINDKTLPSDKNTFSAVKIINEIGERALSRVDDDEAAGVIKFTKGLNSSELIEANNGLVVRKNEIVEASFMSLTEESVDSIVEQLSVGGGASTLGEMENVSEEANNISETDDLLVRLAGAEEWTVNTDLYSNVSQLMKKVFPFTFSLSGGGTYEKGSTQNVHLSWSYDREISSQSMNGELMAGDLRSKQYTGVFANSTYTLSAVCEEQTYTKSVSAEFRLKKYYGVSANDSLTNEQIVALIGTWAERAQRATTFDCTGGKYPYYILPTSMVSDIQFWIGGLRNTDWIEEVRNVTNVYGYTESYTIFRLNGIQTGVLNIEVK